MKFQMYHYKCDKCKHEFKDIELVGNPYGEFLMRSKLGEMRYLNAMESHVFKYAGDVIDGYLKKATISDLGKAKILHQVFGLCCDLDSQENEFKIGADPACPQCSNNIMYSWEEIFPAEYIEGEILEVTHVEWEKMTTKTKENQLHIATDKVLNDLDRFEII